MIAQTESTSLQPESPKGNLGNKVLWLKKFLGKKPEIATMEISDPLVSGDDTCIEVTLQFNEEILSDWLSDSSQGIQEHRNDHNWRDIFDTAYTNAGQQTDGLLDFTGWNSSYDGSPLLLNEMKEWLNCSLSYIRNTIAEKEISEENLRIMEIGCGSGLILFSLAEQCATYLATDISAQALISLSDKLQELGMDHVDLRRIPAQEPLGEDLHFDGVVLNSIVQYFPDEAYLRKTLDLALTHCTEEGFVFIGDVRNLTLLDLFWKSVALSRYSGETHEAICEKAERDKSTDPELSIDPAFFIKFAKDNPTISSVDILPKLGIAHNEMNCFRYDVIFHRAPTLYPLKEQSWANWSEEGWDLDKLRNALQSKSQREFAFTAIPNTLLAEDHARVEKLHASAKGKSEKPNLKSTVLPIDLITLAKENGYRAKLSILSNVLDGSFSAFFQSLDVSEQVEPDFPSLAAHHPERALVPQKQNLKEKLLLHIQSEIIQHLDSSVNIILKHR